MKRTALTIAALLLVSTGALGQASKCDEGLTISDCIDSVRQQAEASTARPEAAKADELKAQVTAKVDESKGKKSASGADPFASTLASTLTDFLPFLASAFEVDSLAEDGRSLTLNLAPSQLDNQPLRLQAVVHKLEVFDQLEEAIPEGEREERVGRLEEGLDDFDDVEFVATYRLNRKDSRYVADYQGTFAEIVGFAANKLAKAAKRTDDVLSIVQNEIQPFFPPELEDEVTLAQARDALGPTRYLELLKLIDQAGNAQHIWTNAVSDSVEKYFDPFARAVNNRSQWLVTASYRIHDEAVGPESWKGSFRYEREFLGNPERFKAIVESGDADLLDRWNRHAGRHRLVVSVDYEETKSYPSPLADVDLSLDGSHSFVSKVAYGLYLDDAAKRRRLDFSYSYEDVSSDPQRQDRMVASLAVTQQVSDDLSILIGVTYANYAKFLGEVDQRWGAHFGLSYSFDFKDK